MTFDQSDKAIKWLKILQQFMEDNIYPLEKEYRSFTSKNLWQVYPELDGLKAMAREKKLWNLFLPPSYEQYSPGLTNIEYAPLAELMGRMPWSAQVFNCSAPDTGNMEVLAKYGTDQQKQKWLEPLLQGSVRSAFLMTEPDVASSDARNINCSINREGNHYIINGHKWWSTGGLHPQTRFFILMGKSNPEADRNQQQSMIVVPADSPGVRIKRPLSVFGYLDAPEGHAEIELDNVKVPSENLILREGAGFEIAQGRLGPGRIHHCMRLIGSAQRALEMMCQRVSDRSAFGRKIASFSSIRQDIAISLGQIEQARLLCYKTAYLIDTKGISDARDHVAMIKMVIPRMACSVIDRSIQAHGGLGLCQDTCLPEMWTYARALRLADGPDEVHMYQLGRNTIKKYTE